MLAAAIANGANAVYFGLQAFNARLRAGNFRNEELAELVADMHEKGVSAYVTLNTLVYPSEMPDAASLIDLCTHCGVDAMIVQDLGIAALIQRMAPAMRVFASTQMTLTCTEAIEATRELGLQIPRVIVPRELTTQQIAELCESSGVEIEVFVHGAICISYSGQCQASRVLGGRSANRGECAQPCRLPYDVYVDGRQLDTCEICYPLSPNDLCVYGNLKELVDAGVASLKIEGRMKSPAYVAATVRTYREGLEDLEHARLSQEQLTRLAMTFSRGFTRGYLGGASHTEVVEGISPKARGLRAGTVLKAVGSRIEVNLTHPLAAGDGVAFVSPVDNREQGGRVFHVLLRGKEVSVAKAGARDVELELMRGSVDCRKIRAGHEVWKTSDPRIERELTVASGRARRRDPVDATLIAAPRLPVELRLCDTEGREVAVVDDAPAESAHGSGLTYEDAFKQLARMGDTPYELRDLRIESSSPFMVPFSRLNALRRKAVGELVQLRRNAGLDRQFFPEALASMRSAPASVEATSESLSILCRSMEQVQAACAIPGASLIYVDLHRTQQMKEAAQIVRAAGLSVGVATSQIIKPGEIDILRELMDVQPDAVLVRNLAAWHFLKQAAPKITAIADQSLNIANDLGANLLLNAGFARLTPAADLPDEELPNLFRYAPAGAFEIVLFQHVPMFHMEYCMYSRFLAQGRKLPKCGTQCERHQLEIRDRKGFQHPVIRDALCRNTVFSHTPTTRLPSVKSLRGMGVKHFRIEFLNESAAEVSRIGATV